MESNRIFLFQFTDQTFNQIILEFKQEINEAETVEELDDIRQRICKHTHTQLD